MEEKQSSGGKILKRPTGALQIRTGLGLIVACAVYVLLDLVPGGLPVGMTIVRVSLAGLAASVFLLFWGSMLRAIWFLPGAETKALPKLRSEGLS